MKSAPLADAALAFVAAPVDFPAAPEIPNEPFGAVLEEAAEELEASDAADPAEEKPEDDAALIPLVAYFSPPPNVETAPLLASDASSKVDETISDDTTGQEPTIAEGVDPNETSREGDALDLKLFEPVSAEITEAGATPVEPPKVVEMQGSAVATASHGTLVAQLEKRVKNSEKSAEIAPAIEQKMPVREVSRRAVAEIGRVESFHAEKQPGQLLNPEFEVGPAELIPLKSADTTRLVETIRTEVTNLRLRADATMTVVLRPDSGTQLSLDVSIGRDGIIHAQARCERGDFQTLNAQWPQLQQSLAAHGIRIADLSNQNNPQQQPHHSNADHFQNFDHNQNSQREQREVSNFEEQFSASRNKIPLPLSKPQPSTATVAPSPRSWQSWA